jgi:translation initiation factor IF-3
LAKKFFRVNHQIRVPEVYLIDESGNIIGNISLQEALSRAQGIQLDLVEVSPNATPPVCKIIDFGKFKYELEKQERKQKARNKAQELKEIRFSVRIDDHDFGIKTEKARSFLKKRHKVKITIQLRGREMAYQDRAREMLNSIISQLKDMSKIEQELKRMGNRFFVVLAPDHKPVPKVAENPMEQTEKKVIIEDNLE